ncbi:nuclear transport factor 2 family protein [Microlunatus flavus]|uniref:SnoaL-like domain-containing protein n=1 Tax=Microlunatus flavus TaxID=1036181 RepID=A0A1H9H0U1_9ACTN|nr:nuclear transport factor 2 family protein [Microlunatus flavus]SEQ55964.1 SnoaL-like domain-containing protein [Microlunatus flavus]
MTATAHQLLAANLHHVFGERDPDRRRAAAKAAYAEDVRFTDPEETVVGVDALLAKAARLLQDAPGFVFAEAGPAYAAGERAALAWTFGPEGGEPVARGLDVLTVVDGRITEVLTLIAEG